MPAKKKKKAPTKKKIKFRDLDVKLGENLKGGYKKKG